LQFVAIATANHHVMTPRLMALAVEIHRLQYNYQHFQLVATIAIGRRQKIAIPTTTPPGACELWHDYQHF